MKIQLNECSLAELFLSSNLITIPFGVDLAGDVLQVEPDFPGADGRRMPHPFCLSGFCVMAGLTRKKRHETTNAL
jgi:hypothetical protein